MARPARTDAATRERINQQYARLPLAFERNDGQVDRPVEFLSRGAGYSVFLSADGEALVTVGGAEKAALRLKPLGARRHSHGEGREPLAGRVNYLRGDDPARWRTGIRTYARVAYDDVYPGIDLVYYGNHREIEFDFVVQPGADPSLITLAAEGADRLEVDKAGDLVFHLGGQQLRQRVPLVYQERDGVRLPVEGRYVLRGSHAVGFDLGRYEPTLPLVIDPVLVYSTYLGGAFRADPLDVAHAIAVDETGNAYVAGGTDATDFPTTAGAAGATYGGNDDIFVTKLAASGASLVYSTYLGGADFDGVADLAIDSLGHAYLTGRTKSFDFPTTPGAYDTSLGGGEDAFVARLDPDGASLAYSTFVGGSSGPESGHGIAIDPVGRAIVVGVAHASDFPTTANAFDTTFGGLNDTFVTMLDAGGASLVYSTLLGGSSSDEAWDVAVDAFGYVYVAGQSASPNFPTTPGAFDTGLGGNVDGFVTKLDHSGAALVYSTYLGGGGQEELQGVAIDGLGEAYVTGHTSSSDFPVTPGAFDTTLTGGTGGFVTKLNAAGNALAYSTFLGGSDEDSPRAVVVDAAGQAFVMGLTQSSDFPVTPGAFDVAFRGPDALFVTALTPTGTALVYSTFLAHNAREPLVDPDLWAGGIAVHDNGDAYVVGGLDGDLPTTAGAYDTSHNGGLDAFVARLNAAGSALSYATYLGGHHRDEAGKDSGLAVAVDGSGSAYVTGSTGSFDFPTTVGAHDVTWNGAGDVFVTKLDPVGAALVYSTLLGGRSADRPSSMAVDDGGNVYVAGETESIDFPTTPGAYDSTASGSDAFVTKLNASGSALVYSTFLGGTSSDLAEGLALGTDASVYVAGSTYSTDFPTTPGAYDETANGQFDVFVARLDPAGAALMYATFLGGSGHDWDVRMAIDVSGDVYVAGRTGSTGTGTGSTGFPTTVGSFDRTPNGHYDAFVTKVEAGGTTILYSTLLGGSEAEEVTAIAVDALGQAHVVGRTESVDFPTTPGAFDVTLGGRSDAFVTKLAATGAALVYSTYLGGGSTDAAAGLVLDQTGQAHVIGSTYSTDFPTTPDAFDSSLSRAPDGFVSTVRMDGASLSYSTFLGATSNDSAGAIAIDAANALYVVGSTLSPNFPTTPGSFDSHGAEDVFVVKLADVGPAAPRVDITANDSDGPITLVPDEPLTIRVAVDTGGRAVIDSSEVYLGVATPSGRLWFDGVSQRFAPELRPMYTGPLSTYGPVTFVDLANVSSLPSGVYRWFIWVDYDADGIPGGGAFDVVATTVP
jgi:hypothetical protein